MPPTPPTRPATITYFSRFGVDEALLRQTLAVAMSKGGDRADVFIQHRVSRTMALEDGEVNRAFASVELGAGVRVVRGDQTGYGYTEELTLESLKNAAVDGRCDRERTCRVPAPSRSGPTPALALQVPQALRARSLVERREARGEAAAARAASTSAPSRPTPA
jgi:predicted Zn-dependent protease